MKTRFEEIVDVASIGAATNPIPMNAILGKANAESLVPSMQDTERVLLLCIDVQQDFMDHGALGVPGAIADVGRASRWIYANMERITKVAVSLDTHNPFQIFHPCWWVDDKGKNPPPFTAITLKDLDAGKWKAVINPVESRDYVENLEKRGKKVLVIWTYHCLQGTSGQALENQFGNMVYFHSVAKKSVAIRMVKGQDPMSEMYGILKAEYDPNNRINVDFLNKMKDYDKVVILGEAKSHCVLESIDQIFEFYAADPEMTKKVYIVEDCMSCIPGFEADTNNRFAAYKKDFGANIVKSTSFSLGGK